MNTIREAVEAVGGQGPLASILGVHPSLISQWATGRLKVGARHCIAIERASQGAVSRHDLRPDIFGEPADAAAAANDPDADRIAPPVETA